MRDHGMPADGETRADEDPLDHDRDLRLWLRLLTCTSLVEGEVRRRLRRDFGTSLATFDLMAQIAHAGADLSLSELSRRLMVSNGNVTQLVLRMSRQGLVDRRPRAADRRTVLVGLTASGRAAFERMAEAHRAWIGELFWSLSAREGASLMGELARLKASVLAAIATRPRQPDKVVGGHHA